MYITVVELPEFRRRIEHLLDENEQEKLVTYLSLQPKAGVLLQGTGGVRKLRWARSGTGKSGGIRVIFFFITKIYHCFCSLLLRRMKKKI